MTFSIRVPAVRLFNEKSNKLISLPSVVLNLEHSLISISKWESKWKKPFLTDRQRTREESIDYVRCMTINSNVDPRVYDYLPAHILQSIQEYMDDPMTATTFPNTSNGARSGEDITSEVIYYWMASYGIPAEYQKWHINRLLTLIRVCNVKSQPAKKMSRKAQIAQQKELNAARKASLQTRG